MAKQLIITGGSSVIAKGISDFWSTKHPKWTILSPTSNELNVTNSEQVKKFFHAHDCELLICCAGYSDNQVLSKATWEAWERTFNINLHGAAACAKAASLSMQRNYAGHIIFLSSYAALRPTFGQSAYATAKAALIGLGKSLALEWGMHNIRVNTILPGWIESPMTLAVSAERHTQVLAEHALARFNTTQAVAAFISTLHQDLIHTSGQCFALDSRIS